jgi:hypothetical protein
MHTGFFIGSGTRSLTPIKIKFKWSELWMNFLLRNEKYRD